MKIFKKINKAIFLYGLIIFVAAPILLYRQLNSNYIDYGEGSYLYASWYFYKGFFPYTDFIFPHPPVLLLWGSFLMKIWNSVYFIRLANLIIYLASNFLLFRIVKKIFNSTLTAFLICIMYFFLPISSFWWPTFTTETLFRILVLLALNLVLPLRSINTAKLFFLSLISAALIFLKYSSFPIIFLLCLVIFLSNRRKFMTYLINLIVLTFGVFFILMFITKGAFLNNTFFIRKNIEFKPLIAIIYSMSYFFAYYISMIVINIMIGAYFLKQKEYEKSILLIVPIVYLINIIVTFYDGTYNYIVYPVEYLIPLGTIFLISSKLEKNKLKKIGKFKLTVINLLLFLSLLSIFYFFQIFKTYYYQGISAKDQRNSQEIKRRILKYSQKNEQIIAPPFFLYLSQRQVPGRITDPFIWNIIAKNKSNPIKNKINEVKRKIEQGLVPIIVLDWRLKYLLKIDNNFLKKKYILDSSYNFDSNETENLNLYLRK